MQDASELEGERFDTALVDAAPAPTARPSRRALLAGGALAGGALVVTACSSGTSEMAVPVEPDTVLGPIEVDAGVNRPPARPTTPPTTVVPERAPLRSDLGQLPDDFRIDFPDTVSPSGSTTGSSGSGNSPQGAGSAPPPSAPDPTDPGPATGDTVDTTPPQPKTTPDTPERDPDPAPASPSADPVPTEPQPPAPRAALGVPRSLVALTASRASFGATPELLEAIEAAGPAAWIESQLDPSSIADPVVDGLLGGYNTLTNSDGTNTGLRGSAGGRDQLRSQLPHGTLLRATYSQRQLYEVMVAFWNNHFLVHHHHGYFGHYMVHADRHVARAHALGRFSDMLIASAQSPAMLLFLDNRISNANGPSGVNENYGREVLELHTLGILGGQHIYTEEDVHNVSLVLSGWSTANPAGDGAGMAFNFVRWWHHRGPVSILGGAWSRPDRTGADDATLIADGESLLRFLARHPSTARYLAFKLARRFVSDDPPESLVSSLAQVYLANDTAIAPVLRALFASPEFAASGGAKLRRGFEIAVAYLRATGAVVDPAPMGPASVELHSLDFAAGTLERLGQQLFSYRSPDGYPDTALEWLGTDSVLRRWETAGLLTHNALSSGITVNARDLLPSPLPATNADLVDAMMARFAAAEPSATTRDALIAHLGGGAGASPPAMSDDRVADFVALCLATPEVQYR